MQNIGKSNAPSKDKLFVKSKKSVKAKKKIAQESFGCTSEVWLRNLNEGLCDCKQERNVKVGKRRREKRKIKRRTTSNSENVFAKAKRVKKSLVGTQK